MEIIDINYSTEAHRVKAQSFTENSPVLLCFNSMCGNVFEKNNRINMEINNLNHSPWLQKIKKFFSVKLCENTPCNSVLQKIIG